jgi:3-hydroxybutyrate dehydrogenase
MQLEGRRAVVTGGGRGIGKAVALALAEAGASVVVAARSKAMLDEVEERLRNAGHQAWAVPCDVGDPESVRHLAAAASTCLGQVDILVNNAGIAQSAPIHRIDLDDWNHLFRVNVTGTLLCTQAFLPDMVERGWGRIVNMASVAGLSGAKYVAAYSATKHAVIGFTRSAAAEVATSGVTVNAVCPGYVDTDMTQASVAAIVRTTGMSDEDALEAILSMSPQHRLLEPEEVAHAVVALCVDRARGINGQAIVIDGGSLLA